MLYRVIISHNQTDALKLFPKVGYTVVVLDSPSNMDLHTCTSLGYHVVRAEQSGNRGYNRNVGLSYILNNFIVEPTDTIEFLDGDRYPISSYSIDSVETIMAHNNLDCLLYTCDIDARLKTIEVPSSGTRVIDTGTICNPFYSCGFAIKMSAINRIMAFNKGSFFEPKFTKWGCEDQFMGLECYNLNLVVGLTTAIKLNGNVGGDSCIHFDYRESLQTYVDLIQEHGFQIRSHPLF